MASASSRSSKLICQCMMLRPSAHLDPLALLAPALRPLAALAPLRPLAVGRLRLPGPPLLLPPLQAADMPAHTSRCPALRADAMAGGAPDGSDDS